ncbi:MAG: helix-turn-helix domain-containing protein [Beijerinckiaceae bacterium]|nr:helix-turn-helix domain-containing protein [Beijerinckiaceae bacterium]
MKPEAEPLTAEQIEARFKARYATYQYHFVEFFTEHLADCSRAFGGDLQLMLVLALMGQMHLQALVAQKQNPDHRAPSVREQKITASRIADASGIPRETVRRKLTKLEQWGWVEQEGSGAWRIVIGEQGSNARRDLAELDQRAMARIAVFYHKLQTIIKS